jgi:hypothetical protein
MTDELFKLLEQNNIIDGNSAFEIISKLEYDEVLDFAMECFMSIKPTETPNVQSLFRFAPIASIAGGRTPCMMVSCRLEAAYSLSLLGTLYADQLVLPNFFDYMYYIVHCDKNPPETEEEFAEFVYNLASDIAVCFLYRPLLEAGVAVINCTLLLVCKDCHNKKLKETDDFRKELNQVLKTVEPKLKQKVRFVFGKDQYITIENDDNYLGGDLGFGVRNKLLKAMQKHSEALPYTLTESDINEFGLFEKIIDDSVNDILEYDYYPSLYTSTYLTNRQFDIDLIEGTNKRSGSSKLINRFPIFHKVPYLQDIMLEDLVSLRQSEADAFQLYRDAVVELVKKDDEMEAKDFFSSTVEPAIHRINSIVNDNKERFRARAGKKIITRSILALAGVGTANLLGIPSAISTGLVGTTGLATISDIVDDITMSNEVPTEAKQNTFYFLWGVKLTHGNTTDIGL